MNLVKDNIKRLYFKFLIPSLGSAMVMSIYTLTDAIVIGKGVGADALAALSITTPLLCILMATGILFGIGGSVQMSVLRGTGDWKKADCFFTLSFLGLAVICGCLWICYGLFMPVLLRKMGADGILFPYAMEYMRYINYFLPFALFSNYIAIFVRADQDPNRAMTGVILGGVLNIVLDILFVFPMQKGMGGAALASVLGMVLQVFVGGSHLFSKRNGLHLVVPTEVPVIRSVLLIFSNGIPSFFNEFANGFIVLLFNIQILKYCGKEALSVYSVIANCVILFNSLFTGVGQAISPIVSTNYGAGKGERICVIRRMAYVTVGILGVVFSLSGLLFPLGICGIFLEQNVQITQIAQYGIRIYFTAFLPLGINLLTSYYLQSLLLARESLGISVLRNVVLSGAGILLFPLVFGAESLWAVIPVVEVLVLFVSLWFLRNTMQHLRL